VAATIDPHTCVLVVSCDRYRDLWTPFFTLFFRYWPDCPYEVYLSANEASYDDPRVTPVLVGPDRSWSTNLVECLARLKADYLIIFQEDFLLTRQVGTDRIARLVSFMKGRDAGCLRLMPSPPPERIVDADLGIGEISRGALYRVSLQTAIWRKDILYALLKEGESPWDLEMAGSARSNLIDAPFLSISGTDRSNWPLDYFSTGVVQGKWVREAVAICRREGITIDRRQRAFESKMAPLRRKCLAALMNARMRFRSSSRNRPEKDT
jgi:hypothetical protein